MLRPDCQNQWLGGDCTWSNISSQPGTSLCAVTHPDFSTMCTVIGCEQELVACDREVLWRSMQTAYRDILNHHGPYLGPIALPQLTTVSGITSHKIGGSVHIPWICDPIL